MLTWIGKLLKKAGAFREVFLNRILACKKTETVFNITCKNIVEIILNFSLKNLKKWFILQRLNSNPIFNR